MSTKAKIPDGHIRQQLTQEKLKFADRCGAEIGDRAGFFLPDDTDRRHNGRDQNQDDHDCARNHGEDTLESLVVAELICSF